MCKICHSRANYVRDKKKTREISQHATYVMFINRRPPAGGSQEKRLIQRFVGHRTQHQQSNRPARSRSAKCSAASPRRDIFAFNLFPPFISTVFGLTTCKLWRSSARPLRRGVFASARQDGHGTRHCRCFVYSPRRFGRARTRRSARRCFFLPSSHQALEGVA